MDTCDIQEKILRTTNRFHRMHYEGLLPDISRREYELMAAVQDYMDCMNGMDGRDCDDSTDCMGSSGKGERKKGICVSELALRLKVSSPAISRMVGMMEEKGYIGRGMDKEDRRNTYIYLTEKGRAAKKESETALCRLMERVTLRMGEDDMQQLIMLWNRLADIMEQELRAEDV